MNDHQRRIDDTRAPGSVQWDDVPAAAQPVVAGAARLEGLTDELERIAQSWDGCEYDAPGEMIDIGASLRRAFSGIATQSAKQGAQPSTLSGALNHARDALRFYADRCHFHMHQPDEWDTVSGEPQNFYEDSNNTATVEDGSIAKLALEDIAGAERFTEAAQVPADVREQARNEALAEAARCVEARFIGYRDDDADLREIATAIRALMKSGSQDGEVQS